jgi:hypothetical protein
MNPLKKKQILQLRTLDCEDLKDKIQEIIDWINAHQLTDEDLNEMCPCPVCEKKNTGETSSYANGIEYGIECVIKDLQTLPYPKFWEKYKNY